MTWMTICRSDREAGELATRGKPKCNHGEHLTTTADIGLSWKERAEAQVLARIPDYALEAERRMGKLLAQTERAKGTVLAGKTIGGHTVLPPENDKPTLAQVGIDKKLSSRSQAIASIPEKEFEETLAEHREGQQAVTAKAIQRHNPPRMPHDARHGTS